MKSRPSTLKPRATPRQHGAPGLLTRGLGGHEDVRSGPTQTSAAWRRCEPGTNKNPSLSERDRLGEVGCGADGGVETARKLRLARSRVVVNRGERSCRCRRAAQCGAPRQDE